MWQGKQERRLTTSKEGGQGKEEEQQGKGEEGQREEGEARRQQQNRKAPRGHQAGAEQMGV